MSDPKRLFEEGGELESILLSSAMDDAPRKGLGRKVHVALGIGGAAFGAGTASTTAAAASKVAPLLASLGVAKWAGIVAIGTTTLVGAAVVHRATAPAVRQAPSSAVTAASPRAPVRPVDVAPLEIPAPPPVPSPVEAISEPSPEVKAPAPVTVEARALASLPSARASAPPIPTPRAPQPELADELAVLDRAKVAIDLGDAQAALAALDRHDLDFARGDLAQEALAMRVEAYALRHDDAKVMELGARFLATYRSALEERRVRALMSAASATLR